MPAWTITRITESVRLDPAGSFRRTRIVAYMVGDHGPFQVEVPAEGFSAESLRALLDEQAAHIVALTTPT